ncbi:MAG: AarF/ABC1/UbiB kinase family protein [Chitinophagaceae bacterium]|nr:AarF/ABC1/UbiB kinase family protein [Chitinophagaceae bacterium]
MKTLDHIPVSKVSRASKLVLTGAKIGVNYLNYYKDKIVESEQEARKKLHENNASDIYDSLSKLKGSALKVAQMLSMDKSLLPQQYVEKFSLSQFSVPPLSGPLVNKTFQRYFGKLPAEMFDEFEEQSVNAASIGQVHRAKKDGKLLAIKIQYPGVAESIQSDLKMVKPVAIRMFNLQGKDSDKYFNEVEEKLLEETDYILEVKRSIEIAKACAHIKGLRFPKYYPEWSSQRIITMDYMEGEHLSEFSKRNKDSKLANKIGQALWDFYMFQIHQLRKVHADPHPGNFMVSKEGDLIAIDFGCVKEIPDEFYFPYFELRKEEVLNSPQLFKEKMLQLELIKETDTKKEIQFFSSLFNEMISTFMTPLKYDTFDFSDISYFNKVYDLAEKFNTEPRLKKFNSNRGSKHFIYINRTFFGLYSLLHDLKANNIKINF